MAVASSPFRKVVASTPARPQSSVTSTPCDSKCVSSASTSSSLSSSDCASSSSSDRFTQPRSSPRAISAATSGREASSCAHGGHATPRRRPLRKGGRASGATGVRRASGRRPTCVGDLRLREVLLEPQAEYQPLARRQCLQRAAQRLPYLDELIPVLVVRQRLGERPALLLAAPGSWRVERDGLVRGRGLHGLQHVLHRRAHGRGDVPRRGRAAEPCRQRAERLAHLQYELLGRPRHVDRPALVPEVALDLAEHRGHRVAGEAVAAVRVVAVDRLDQADAGNLDEVLERLAGVAVAGRELARERHEAHHELVARVEIPVAVIARKESVVLEPPRLWRLSRRLPQQDGWCHVSHITLSGRCETWWGVSRRRMRHPPSRAAPPSG